MNDAQSNASRAAQSLDEWFAQGHTRFVMALQGSRQGLVLLAQPGPDGKTRFTERGAQFRADGSIQERFESSVTLADLAADPVNGPALARTLDARLNGAHASVAICKPRPPKR
jgi:hypothetical protein